MLKEKEEEKCIIIENITKKLKENIRNKLFSLSKIESEKILIKYSITKETTSTSNNIDLCLLNMINSQVSVVKYNNKEIFSFIEEKNEDKTTNKYFKVYPRIFRRYLIIRYKKNLYHIQDMKLNSGGNFYFSKEPLCFLLDLENNDIYIISKNDLSLMCVKLKNGNENSKINASIELKKVGEFHENFSSHYFNTEKELSSLNYEYNSVFIDKKSNNVYFYLKNKIFLFSSINNGNTLFNYHDQLDISSYTNTLPIIYNNNLCFINYSCFVYKLKSSPISKKSLHVQNNKNISEIFINEKDKNNYLNLEEINYCEIIEKIKIILFVGLIIKDQNLEAVKKDKGLDLIFREYKIDSYVETLEKILNKDNYIFYLKYNLENNKFFVILIFLIIFDRYELLQKSVEYSNDNEKLYLRFIIKNFIDSFFIDFEDKIDQNKINQIIN